MDISNLMSAGPTGYILDILIVVGLFSFVFGCAKRGFINVFFSFVSSVVALFAAISLAGVFASLTGGLFGVEESLIESFTETFSKMNGFNVDLAGKSELDLLLSTGKVPAIIATLVAKKYADVAIAPGTTLAMLKFKTQGLGIFIYGTLAAPITAKEIRYTRTFLRETHKDSPIIAVDAAVGDAGDIGLIKLNDSPLMPGAGANKQLGSIGDISIMGIVAEKSIGNYGLLNTTRLNLVYSMAEIVSNGLAALLWEYCKREKNGKIEA